MKTRYHCHILPKDDHSDWDTFIDSLSHEALFSKASWLAPVTQVTGKGFQVIACYKGDELVGGIALQISKRINLQIGHYPILTPNLGPVMLMRETKYGFKNESQAIQMSDALIHFLENQYDYITFTTYDWWNDIRPFQWRGWRSRVSYTYKINLRNIDINTIDINERNKVRRAEKQNVQVKISDNIEHLQKSLVLQEKTYERQQKRFPLTTGAFVDLFSGLQQHGIVLRAYIAEMDNRCLASMINVLYRTQAYCSIAGADPEYLHTGANQLLWWEVIKDLRDSGYTIFDLCGGNHPSISAYKAKFGGKLTPYYCVTWMRPYVKALSHSAKMATRVIKRLHLC